MASSQGTAARGNYRVASRTVSGPQNTRSGNGFEQNRSTTVQQSGGWQRFGEPNSSAAQRSGASANEESGWHRFGQPQQRTTSSGGSYGGGAYGNGFAQRRLSSRLLAAADRVTAAPGMAAIIRRGRSIRRPKITAAGVAAPTAPPRSATPLHNNTTAPPNNAIANHHNTTAPPGAEVAAPTLAVAVVPTLAVGHIRVALTAGKGDVAPPRRHDLPSAAPALLTRAGVAFFLEWHGWFDVTGSVLKYQN